MLLRLLIATLLVGLASGSSCVDTCSSPSLCNPITKPLAAKETLVFTTLSSADWKSYDWTKITTFAIFSGGDDDAVAEVTCLAHAFGVRVVKGEQFPMDDIYDNDAMKAFIDSKVDEAKRLGLDGLNFDNEGLTGSADILAQRIHEVKVAFKAEFEPPRSPSTCQSPPRTVKATAMTSPE
ncbi:hypothetical protein TrVE_jg13068 [Triparma verrucosa]|uniref:Uncharacterized protein n=1 Tax=Triparma verrucosa TaxID=1606542 RepID=A0A9W7CE01_9STRA|nr:hypothetical protein TrVE_jg13068 [Triparma verrucosa]